ncbi:hypothetical protein [Bradyrhizobium sp. JR3.5]
MVRTTTRQRILSVTFRRPLVRPNVWINATSGSGQPAPNPTYWQVLASKGDTGAQGPQGNPGTNGANAPTYGGTSATSLVIGTGAKVFTTQAGLAYLNGARVRASSNGSPANWMEGIITYSGSALTITVDKTNGSGTFTDWNFNVVGQPGAGDLSSSNNLSDLSNKAVARINLGVRGVLTPEQFGAVGDGVTNDTAAFTALAAAINAAPYGVVVEFGFGKNYRVWTTTPATQSVLMSLSGVNGLKINFNGSQITNPINFGTSNIILYWFLLLNCQNVEINGPSFDQVNYHTLDSNYGCHGIYLQDYCRGIRINNIVQNGGITGVAVTRSASFNRGLRARDIFMSGDFTNVYYPANFQRNGDEVELRYRSRNAGRSYFAYNVRQHEVVLDSQSAGAFDDCLLKVYADPAESNGENTLSEIDLHYTNLGRQVSNPNTGSLVRLGIDQATTTTAAGFLRNIKLTFDVDTGSFSNPPLVATTKATSTGASDTTARGHIISNIELSGYINWGLTTTASLELFTNSGTESLGDFSGDTVEMITFRNFSLYGASAPFNINAACIDRGLRFENCFITGTMSFGTLPQKLLDASANVSGTVKSFSESGTPGVSGYQAYRRLPDGGVEAWGIQNATSGANTAVSFALAFSTLPNVVCTSTAPGTASPINAASISTTGFQINNAGASTVAVCWHAKGYI